MDKLDLFDEEGNIIEPADNNNQNESETIETRTKMVLMEPIALGIGRRINININNNSLAFKAIETKKSCKDLYCVLSDFYYLPTYNSKCITYNYLIGVFDGIYYCPESKVECGIKVKLTAKAVYFEILKCQQTPLGYNTVNLPKRKYLINVLYSLNPEHPIFSFQNIVTTFPMTENGLYMIPISCRKFIKCKRAAAIVRSGGALTSGKKSTINTLNKIAKFLSYIEHIQYYISAAGHLLSNLPYEELPNYQKLVELFSLIS